MPTKQSCSFFLLKALSQIETEKVIVATQDAIVMSSYVVDQSSSSSGTPEKADTEMMVDHTFDAQFIKREIIRTMDTDVATRHPGLEVWIAIETGKSYRCIAAHSIASAKGVDKPCCSPICHGLFVCDPLPVFSFWQKEHLGCVACLWRDYAYFSEIFHYPVQPCCR